MFLAGFFNFISVFFGKVLAWLYQTTGNYGIALILFTVIVQLVLFPITAKSKKSMMKMSRLQPKMQAIRNKYPDDQAKQQEAMRALQQEEGVGMGCGGCLWSLVPMLLLIPLLSVIREPLTYMLGCSAEVLEGIAKALGHESVEAARRADIYWQIDAAQKLFRDSATFQGVAGITPAILKGVDMTWLGLNLGLKPPFNVFRGSFWVWGNVGLALIPILSAGSQILQMKISQKMNNSVVTNDKGVQDKEAAENAQSAQTGKMMMWMMPAMSALIGFSVSAGLSLYWFLGGVIRTIEDIFLTKHYRKVYDAEDAIKLKIAMEREAEEAEKERIRAERRAANPDGITANTSKKKLQQKQKEEQRSAKAAAAKEYAAKRGLLVEEEEPEETVMSGIPERPFCKGRNYDPNRYNSTEE